MHIYIAHIYRVFCKLVMCNILLILAKNWTNKSILSLNSVVPNVIAFPGIAQILCPTQIMRSCQWASNNGNVLCTKREQVKLC